LTKRVEEIGNEDKTKQTILVQEDHRSRRGHNRMNGDHRRNGGVVFVGGGAVLLIILLVIVLV